MLKIVVIALALIGILACSPLKPVAPGVNNNPVIESVTYARDSMAKIDNEFLCQASDADGDKLEYLWYDSEGNSIGKGQSIMWVAPENMGNYSITVKVLDNKGGETRQSMDVRVLNNADGSSAAPVKLLMQFPSDKVVTDNRTVKVGTVTRIDCVLEKTDTKTLTYTWNASGGSIRGKGMEQPAGTAFWTAPANTILYDVTVDIKDKEGRTARGLITFDVFCCPRN